jgi:hypothetical protein
MRSGAFWAVLLILAGVLLLLGNLGVFDRWEISVWNLLWPVFLIALGAWFIIGYFVQPAPLPTETAVIPLEGAAQASIEFQHGAGVLTVGSGTAAGELVEGTFGGGLNQRVRRNGATLDVKLSVPTNRGWIFPWTWTPGQLDWDLRLNETIPLELEFETGASRSQIDLSDLLVRDLKLETGASDTEVTLPARAGLTRVKIESGAARVVVRVPGGVAATIRSESGLARVDIDRTRFVQTGDHRYESPDYAAAVNKADIRIETGVGTVIVA